MPSLRITLWFLIALSGWLCPALSARAELRAGAARVDITPDIQAMRVPLGGYAARKGAPAEGVQDRIFARALVLSNDKTKLGIVSLDLCFLPANVTAEVVRRVRAAGVQGLNVSNLMLAATHTHSAPDPLAMHRGNTFAFKNWPVFDAKLLDFTASRVAEAIIQADKRQVPASVAEGSVTPPGVRVTFEERVGALNKNRRGEPLTDPAFTFLRVTDRSQKLIALLINFAAHPTLYDDKMRLISGDWPGTLEASLEGAIGGVCLFLNGAEGDASPNGAIGNTPRERVNHYVELLATLTMSWLDGFKAGEDGSVVPPLASKDNVPIAAWTQAVILPSRKPNGLFLAAALQLGVTVEQGKKLVTGLMPTTTRLSFIRIGSLLLIGFPCEPTTPLGLAAKEAARKAGYTTPAVVALANDWLGYALTPEQYRAGGYEASMSFYGEQLGPTLLTALKVGLARGASFPQ